MKIDLHTHGKLAKKLPFSEEYTDWLFGEAVNAGLDAICLTEHFNTLEFDKMYKYIREVCSKEGETYITESGLRIFPGMEVDIAEGGHTLVIGTMDVILEMNQRLEPHKEKETFLPMEKLAQTIEEYPVVFGAGHPYRCGGNIPKLPLELQKKFDFIDMNGKDMAGFGAQNILWLEEMSEKLGKPIAAGSDTHQAFQYGCIYNECDRTCRTGAELLEILKEGSYHTVLSDYISFQVKTAGMLKRSLKTIHALGGDYVEVLLSGVE